jgi:hypothetical protein
MDDAIKRLRQMNPCPDELAAPPLAPVLARLDQQFDGDIDHPRPQPAVRRRRHRAASLTAIAGGASVIIVVAVVVVAVALLGGHNRTGSAPSAHPHGVAPPRAELIRTISVLRRPQTKVDLNPQLQFPIQVAQKNPQRIKALARWGDPKLDRGLLRVVTVPSLHAQVLIAPTTYQPSTTSRQRSEGITLNVHSPGNGLTGSGPKPTTVSRFLAHGLSVFVGPHDNRTPGVVLVPDGVARVALGPPQPLRDQTPDRSTAKDISDAIANLHRTSVVHNNLAAFDFAIPTIAIPQGFSGVFGIEATAPAIWYSASRTVIRRTTTTIDLLVRIRGDHPNPAIRERCRQDPHRPICKR